MPKEDADNQPTNLVDAIVAMAKDHLGKKEFTAAFKKVTDFVKAFETATVEQITTLSSSLTEMVETKKAELSDSFATLKADITSTLQSAIASMRDEHDAKMREVDEKLATVENGLDADEEAITARVTDNLRAPITDDIEKRLPVLGTAVRDSLELLPEGEKLIIDAIEGLRAELDELKKAGKSFGGGSMGLSVGHWAQHEAFTMDGVATSVTLTQGGIGAAGNAVFVRYQGQLLDHGVQYTVSGNKITLVGFTPEVDTIISVTYWQ